MRTSAAPGGHGPNVVIIGGGASGTLTAVHLLAAATARRTPLRVTMIDRYGRHGQGQAYATTHPAHLLNAPARQMSAVAGDPDHFSRWASTKVAGGTDGAAFLPREAYGRYLRSTLADAQRQAEPLARLQLVTSEVQAIQRTTAGRPLRITLSDGWIDADVVVLATGNLPGTLPFPAPSASSRVIADPWAPGALDRAADGSPVIIVGTGLTMLDLAVAVTSRTRRTTVHAISRHGLLPRPHEDPPAACGRLWLPAISGAGGPIRLAELIWQVRSVLASSPDSWQSVISALRPHLPDLWQRLSDQDRRLFLRHVARYWEVHRHRMPAATARRITELRCTGQLRLHQGRITGVSERDGQVHAQVAQSDGPAELSAGWLINGTGPAADITTAPGPLLGDLFARGLARPDPLRLGLDATPAGAVLDAAGTPSSTLFTLGPPLRGVLYETTAIPEIREQAAGLARHLIGQQARQRRGSAA
jgi:uncharacterized NAD(P)/FAD-binding protein YdhS